jgi:pilus assembly protein CpaE
MPLSAILIGSHARNSDVRQCLQDLSVSVIAEFANAADCMRSLPVDGASKSFFAVDVELASDLAHLEHLSTQYRAACMAILDGAPESSADMLALWHQAMRAGACQIVGRPLDVSDVSKALMCLNRVFGEPTPPCMVVAVTQATGGCGATTLAINLAYELSYLTDAKCILVEQEEKLSMLASCLDLHPKYTLVDLARAGRIDPAAIEQALVPYEDKLKILCGSDANLAISEGASHFPTEKLDDLSAILRGMCQFLVLDISCSLTPNYFELLARSDRVAIAMEQTLPSMRNLRLLQDALHPMEMRAPLDVIVNKFDPSVRGFSLGTIKDIIGTDNVWTVANAPAVATGALNLARPMRTQAGRSEVVEDISKIARSLAAAAGCTKIKPPESSSFFRFLRRLA